jgi:threonine dehydrogenase-like Zn-dependent dehydrogenase
LTLGHEFAGEVAEAGSLVNGLKVGQRIVAVPIFSCGRCFACEQGLFHICDERAVHGIDVDGGMAEYVVVQGNHVFPIPDGVPYREAVAVEPVANCVHALERSRVRRGESVAVFGDGFHGLTLLRLAWLLGASPVCFCGHHNDRFPIARQYGADVTINTNDEDPSERICEMLADRGGGVDVAMDSTDSRSALREAVGVVRRAGKLLLFSCPRSIEPAELGPMRMKELDVYMSHSWPGVFAHALRLVSNRLIDVRPMLTHFYPLKDAVRAFEVADKRLDNSIRVSFDLTGEP